MATFRNPRALIAHQRRRIDGVQRSLQIAARDTADAMKEEARRLTSGHVSSKTLAGLGHPFGRGYHGYEPARSSSAFLRRYPVKVAIAPLPINQQSGQLARSLRVFRRQKGGAEVYQLQFTSPHAVVVLPGGTRYMIDRGFWKALNASYKQASHGVHVGAIQRANRSA